MFESKYGLFGDVPGASSAERALDSLIREFISKVRVLERKYPNVGIDDTSVSEAIVQVIYSGIH